MLDRRIVLQREVTIKDSYNAPVKRWVGYATAWAEKVGRRGRETARNDKLNSEQEIVWRFRYADGIRPTDRLVDEGGEIYDIQYIDDKGRRDMTLAFTKAHYD